MGKTYCKNCDRLTEWTKDGLCPSCRRGEPPQSPDPRDARLAEMHKDSEYKWRETAEQLARERDQALAERDRLKEALEGDTLTAKRVNQLLEQRDELQAEVERLKRVIARELSENDDLGAEYTYVRALKEECARLRAEVKRLKDETYLHYVAEERARWTDKLQADNARLRADLENAKTLWARSIEQVCEEQTEALRLREALEWYADIANYGEYEIQGKRGPLRTSNVGYDTGERARQALSGEKAVEQEYKVMNKVDYGKLYELARQAVFRAEEFIDAQCEAPDIEDDSLEAQLYREWEKAKDSLRAAEHKDKKEKKDG